MHIFPHNLNFPLRFSNKEDQQKSIFIKSEQGGFKLDENVQFHLYISTSPCGDARIFSPHEAAQEGINDSLVEIISIKPKQKRLFR